MNAIIIILTGYIIILGISALLLFKFSQKILRQELALKGENLIPGQLRNKVTFYLFKFPGKGDEFSEINKSITKYRYLSLAFVMFGMIGNYTIIYLFLN